MRELKSDVLEKKKKIQGEFFSSKKQDLKVSIYKKLDYMKKNYSHEMIFDKNFKKMKKLWMQEMA